MSYSEATFPELKKKYNILQDYQNLNLQSVREIKPSQRLQDDILGILQFIVSEYNEK